MFQNYECCFYIDLELLQNRDRWNLLETGRRTFLFVPQVNINQASFSSKINQ
ncbi:unnamed protein product, partial [Larinioides sclopetarius]